MLGVDQTSARQSYREEGLRTAGRHVDLEESRRHRGLPRRRGEALRAYHQGIGRARGVIQSILPTLLRGEGNPLAVAGYIGRLAGILDFDDVAPGVRPAAIEIGETVYRDGFVFRDIVAAPQEVEEFLETQIRSVNDGITKENGA